MIKRTVSLCIIAATLLCSSCSTLRKDRAKPAAIIALFQFAAPDMAQTQLVRGIITESGQILSVRKYPLLSSREIIAAKMASANEDSETPGIEFFLDRSGQMRWTRLCAELAGDAIAVTVDGIYRFSIRVPRRTLDPRSLVIRGPWREDELEYVTANAGSNFIYFNRRSR